MKEPPVAKSRQMMKKLKHQELFIESLSDLLRAEPVLRMRRFTQHSDVSCLEHCVCVAYLSLILGRLMGVNLRRVARGALLHDLFLYDWHVHRKQGFWPHGFTHPARALSNARRYFILEPAEEDAILKHMWPLTLLHMPRTPEAAVVCLSDKLCALAEILGVYRLIRPRIRAFMQNALKPEQK